MTKAQGLYQFWAGFGLPVYDESTVPDEAILPYITYETQTDSLGGKLSLSASVWYRSTSWEEVTRKAAEIEDALYGGVLIDIDGGRLWLTRGTPFAQRIEENDKTIRRIAIQVYAEYLTR